MACSLLNSLDKEENGPFARAVSFLVKPRDWPLAWGPKLRIKRGLALRGFYRIKA